jgi:hypothetical protein
MWNGEMLDTGIGLLQQKNREISARIPHQSAARTSLADSFSPGEAKAPHSGAVAPAGRHIYHRKQQFSDATAGC